MSIKLFSASAGSGKTYTLTLEYIKLALREEDRRGYFRKILAVTFTIKAAEEMRSRIIEFLHGISNPIHPQDFEKLASVYSSYLAEGLNISEAEISKRAYVALQQILQDYGLFSVMTIDSFVQRLSSTFIEELNLPSQFEVILDSHGLMDQLIDQLVDKVNRLGDPMLTDLLIDFAKAEVADGRSWNLLRANLHQFLLICLDESYHQIKPHLDVFSMEDFRQIETQIRTHVQEIENQLLDIAIEFIRYVDQLQFPDDFYTGGRYSPAYYFRKFIQDRKLGDFKFSSLQKSIDANQWTASKIDKNSAAEINDIADALQVLGQNFVAIYQTNHARNQILLWIARDIKKVALLASIAEELFTYQHENSAVSISEFSKRLYQVIANDPVPFIYEKLGDRYTHILIDEFQDTSMLQWQNFMPLLENSTSLGHQNLLVGDAKQSIYKFRGGEVGLIASLTQKDESIIHSKIGTGTFDEERYNYLLSAVKNEHLAYNFRSAAEIVSFNNSFFSWISDEVAYVSKSNLVKPIYGRFLEQVARVSEDQYTGSVDLCVFRKPKLDAETKDLEQIWMLGQVISQIEANLALGFSYADIAILVRKNKHAKFLAIQLKEKGYPIISSDSLLIHYSNVVSTLISFLKLKLNPTNEFLGLELLIQLAELHGESINVEQIESFKSLTKQHSNSFLAGIISFFNWPIPVNEFEEYSLFQTIYAVIDQLQLFKQQDGRDYLFKLIDIIQEFIVTKSDTIEEFVSYYEANKFSFTIASPEGANAITITSIHKSKGLEYPVVIIPFANWTHQASNERIWYNLESLNYPEINLGNQSLAFSYGRVAAKEIAEEEALSIQSVQEKHSIFLDSLNMMYVAFTRAKQRLHILTTLPDEESAYKTKQMHQDSLAEILIQYASTTQAKVHELPTYLLNEWSELTDYYILKENSKPRYVSKSLSVQTDKSISLRTALVKSPSFRLKTNSSDLYSQSKTKRAEGEYLHEILAQIIGVDYWLANRETKFQYLEDSIRNLVDEVVYHKTIGKLFIDEELLFVERDILCPDGSILRPDRVVIKSGFCLVVDFKTGKRNDEHLDQIRSYKDLLISLGYKVGEGILLYLDDLSLVYV